MFVPTLMLSRDCRKLGVKKDENTSLHRWNCNVETCSWHQQQPKQAGGGEGEKRIRGQTSLFMKGLLRFSRIKRFNSISLFIRHRTWPWAAPSSSSSSFQIWKDEGSSCNKSRLCGTAGQLTKGVKDPGSYCVSLSLPLYFCWLLYLGRPAKE